MAQRTDSGFALQPSQLAERIRKISVESSSYSEFARTFIRNALAEAATTLETGKQKTDSVELKVKVNIRFALPQHPDTPDVPKPPLTNPEDINICYEICASGERSGSFWACYADCSAPPFGGGVPGELPLQRCQRLWEEFRQGNRFAFLELLQAGCIDFRQILAALEPLMTRVR